MPATPLPERCLHKNKTASRRRPPRRNEEPDVSSDDENSDRNQATEKRVRDTDVRGQ